MKNLLSIFMTPMLWVAWGLLFASNDSTNQWRMPLVCIFTLIPFIVLHLIKPYPVWSEINMTQGEMIKTIIAGILNGIGLILYAILLSDPAKAPLNGAAINFLMPALFILGGLLFFKTEIDTIQWFGIAGIFICLCLVQHKEINELLQKI